MILHPFCFHTTTNRARKLPWFNLTVTNWILSIGWILSNRCSTIMKLFLANCWILMMHSVCYSSIQKPTSTTVWLYCRFDIEENSVLWFLIIHVFTFISMSDIMIMNTLFLFVLISRLNGYVRLLKCACTPLLRRTVALTRPGYFRCICLLFKTHKHKLFQFNKHEPMDGRTVIDCCDESAATSREMSSAVLIFVGSVSLRLRMS